MPSADFLDAISSLIAGIAALAAFAVGLRTNRAQRKREAAALYVAGHAVLDRLRAIRDTDDPEVWRNEKHYLGEELRDYTRTIDVERRATPSATEYEELRRIADRIRERVVNRDDAARASPAELDALAAELGRLLEGQH